MQHFGSAQQSLWMHLLNLATPQELPKERKSILKWRHSHREPLGGSLTPFLSRSNEGRSNRIREHPGALSYVARQTSSLSDEIPLACSDQVFCLSYTTQTAVVSRGMTKCSNVAVLVFTMGHQKKTMFMKDIYQRYNRSYCHSLHTFMLTNTSTHCCINKHSGTHVTPVTAPNRNGYFFIKQIPLALWKGEDIQSLKKVESTNCHTSPVSLGSGYCPWTLKSGQGCPLNGSLKK